jgi:hypothetical protein
VEAQGEFMFPSVLLDQNGENMLVFSSTALLGHELVSLDTA